MLNSCEFWTWGKLLKGLIRGRVCLDFQFVGKGLGFRGLI